MKKTWSNTALVAYSLLPKIAKEIDFAIQSRVKSSFQSRHLKIGVSNEQLIGEILDQQQHITANGIQTSDNSRGRICTQPAQKRLRRAVV